MAMRKVYLASASLIFLSAILFVSSVGQLKSPRGTLKPSATTAQVLAAKNLPLEFIPNAGQTDSRVSFYVKGSDRTIYFTPDGVTLALHKESKAERPKQVKVPAGPGQMDTGSTNSWVIKIDFIGAEKDVVPEGLDKTGAMFSYFKGRPKDWHAGLPGYRQIIYRDLWPGIDLIYKGDVGRLKYKFIVAPGADPGMIQLGIRGASNVEVDEEGRLVLETSLERIIDEKPLVFQEGKTEERKSIAAAYHVKKAFEGEAKVGFSIANYDHSLPLVIDPATLVYCGYIGSAIKDSSGGIAVDSSGNAYIVGVSYQPSIPYYPVAMDPETMDIFVAKVNASGTGLVYCSYIGGNAYDSGTGIAVDTSGNAYITGTTQSDQTTFPVVGGPDITFNGGWNDVFVAKINALGTGLIYCGYIGGADLDDGLEIAVDNLGNAYITGNTQSDQTSFPIAGGPDLTYNGGEVDAFVAKVNASGTGLVYCGYIGGSGNDGGSGIAVDGSGNAYITGGTFSNETSFPVTVGPDITFNDIGRGGDAFVAKINSSGTGLVYCGYIGGAETEGGSAVAVDSSGNAYVTGSTISDQITFPVSGGPDTTYNVNGGWDAFVAKVNASGTGLVYCGYIGGSAGDMSGGIAVDGSGNAYIVGQTESNQTSFPVNGGPDTTYNGGGADAFVAKVNASGTGFAYCGYIGGSGSDGGGGIVVDSSGNAYISGGTGSHHTSFPVKVGPDTTYNGGGGDAFVAKIPPTMSTMADLSLAKSADNIRPYVDDPVSFTITATNLGSRDATGVKVADKLPAGLSFLSADVTQGTYDPTSGLWTIGTLEDPTSAALTLRARVEKEGTIINTAEVAAMNESDADPLNNEASVTLVAEYRVYAPSNFQVQRLENDFIFYKEYINRLTWTANPLNRGIIVSYRLYRKPKEQPDNSFVFYKEFDVSLTNFDDRGLKKDELFSYRLSSVNEKSRESDPVEVGNREPAYERMVPSPKRVIFQPPLKRALSKKWQQR